MRAKPNTRNGKNIKASNNNSSSSNNSNNSAKFSVKKPLKENLATSNQPDNSILRPPVETSVAGLKQVVKLFETGTPEVVHLITYECDVIYECRVCRNLFRSLANFISHKRVYCTRRFNHVQASPSAEDHTILVEEDTAENCSNTLPSRITARQDLTSIMQTSAAQYYKEVEDKLVSRDINRCDATVHLQPIENTTYGVYQTIGKKGNEKLIKNQVSELNRIISTNEAVTLGPDGKIIREGGNSGDSAAPEEHVLVDELICSLCKLKFSSKKTLNHHTKTFHESFRVCYSCPCCKNLFSNTWSVHRHLYKVHRKSNEQVRRLRAQIQKKQVRAEKVAEKLNRKADRNKTNKEDNKAWMEHFEGDTELQRCGGCGRRFERRAALTSHAQICHKRIAACNSLQSIKRKEEKYNETPNDSVTVPAKQQSTQGTPVQKVQSEKRIGIQVRMNYCKNTMGNLVTETRRSERHKSCEEKDEELVESHTFDSLLKDRLISQSNESISRSKSEVMRESDEKVSSCNSSVVDEPNFPEIRKKCILPKTSNRLKMKRLENMCLQLRKAVGLEPENDTDCKTSFVLNSTGDLGTNDANLIKICEDASCDVKKEVKHVESDEVRSKKSNDSMLSSDHDHIKTGDIVLNTSHNDCANYSPEGCDEVSIDSDFPENIVKKDKFSNEKLNSEINDDSNCTPILSFTEHTADESDLLSEMSDRVVPITDLSESETNIGSNSVKDKNIVIHLQSDSEVCNKQSAKDTIGILTRYKVRSIFKSDNTSVDSVTSESLEQEEFTSADESSLKENLNDTHDDDQSNWIQKKMSQYIRYKNKQCIICLKKFKMMFHIKHHVADHLGWNNYHCLFSNCTYATFSKSDCIKHLMKNHLKPHEKAQAPSLVGETRRVKGDNFDSDVTCKFKRKKSDSEDFCLKQTDLKEAADTELKVLEKDSAAIVSINDNNSSEIIREECIQTSKIDSSSEQSDVESRFKQKLKRRKVGDYKKHIIPPIRKCSPDSTTELIEKDVKTSADGAQFRNGPWESLKITASFSNCLKSLQSVKVRMRHHLINCNNK
ncbi:uncharacterized protein LOC142334293 isoform X2 [Lycorma delicatula]|uniref:uncharacterized protein LOC142334293 isoform X2 n=1 Tax=Lycorma delicatula TaxID=130591 RepID=UPI003F51A91A